LVGEGDELGAVGGDSDRRDAAEVAMVGGELEPAAELERAEPHRAGLAQVEGVDGLRRDGDVRRRRGALRDGGRREEAQRDEKRENDRAVARMERERNPGPRAPHSATLHAGYYGATSMQSPLGNPARLGRLLLVEQLGELLGHRAAELLGVDDG